MIDEADRFHYKLDRRGWFAYLCGREKWLIKITFWLFVQQLMICRSQSIYDSCLYISHLWSRHY